MTHHLSLRVEYVGVARVSSFSHLSPKERKEKKRERERRGVAEALKEEGERETRGSKKGKEEEGYNPWCLSP